MLAPIIGLLQVGEQAMADRYTYIPLIGLFVTVAWGVSEATLGWRWRTPALGFAAASVLLALMAGARVQLSYWKNSEALFAHSVKVTTDNPVACFNLGFALAEQKKFAQAAEQYSNAVELRPNYPEAHNNLGFVLMALGKTEDAISHYRMALQTAPNYLRARCNLGVALSSEGKLDEAIEQFKAALELEPDSAEIHYRLASLLFRQGRSDEAASHYREALRLQPNLPPLTNDLPEVKPQN